MTRMQARASRLERWLGRVFADEEPTAVGSGWIAGTAGVFLGVVSVAAALAFTSSRLASPFCSARHR